MVIPRARGGVWRSPITYRSSLLSERADGNRLTRTLAKFTRERSISDLKIQLTPDEIFRRKYAQFVQYIDVGENVSGIADLLFSTSKNRAPLIPASE